MIGVPTDRKMATPLICPLRVSRRLNFAGGRSSLLTFKQSLTCERFKQISFYCEAKGGINEGTGQRTASPTAATTLTGLDEAAARRMLMKTPAVSGWPVCLQRM